MASVGRAIERIVVGAALCVVAIAVGVAVLTAPWFTRTLTTRLDVSAQTGLTAERTSQVAEHVRAFVSSADAPPLPAEVDGRPGFDESAVSHLADVRDVMLMLRLVALVLAVALVAWGLVSLRAGRHRQVAAALRWGGWGCVGLPMVLGLAALVDFEALFTAFHTAFFQVGTWTFPADSLLIELFPEPFWVTAGAALAVLVVVQGACLWLAGRAVDANASARGRTISARRA